MIMLIRGLLKRSIAEREMGSISQIRHAECLVSHKFRYSYPHLLNETIIVKILSMTAASLC
jgi:hypothetical protein